MTSSAGMRRLGCLVGGLLFVQSSVVGAPSALERIKAAGVVVICLDPDNLPYSHSKQTPPGFDVEISEWLAKELGVTAKFHWVDTIRDTALGELLEGACDCAPGTAIDTSAADEMANLGEKVLFSWPYYSTGYVVVTKDGGPQPKALAEVKDRKIGAEAGSVADYHLNLKGYDRRLYPRQESIFSGLDSGEVTVGFMWAPNVGWMLKTDPQLKFKLVDGYSPEPDFRWNVGVAVRKNDPDLKAALDTAIQKLVATQQAQRIIASYGAPYFAPFP